MSWKDDIKHSIMALANTAELKHKPDIYYARVNADSPYDIAKRTCNCTLLSGKSDVNLKSVGLMAEINDGLLILPSPGSTVIIAKAPNSDPYVVMFSQVDQVLYIAGDTELSMKNGEVIVLQGDHTKFSMTGGDTAMLQQGDMQVTLNGNKVSIKNSSSGKDFKTIMNNILNHILALTVPTGTGPSGTPVNAANFNTDLSDFNDIFY